MATHIVETNVSNLKINKLTQAQYIQAVQQGVIGDNELSIITDVVDGVVTVMPTPSASYEDTIVQFAGTTDANYTNGYFYKCVSDGAVSPTYSWENIEVQPAGDSLPDQTGQAGKFLTTDGTDASWGDALTNKATSTQPNSYLIGNSLGSQSNGSYMISIGDSSNVQNCSVAIGGNARSYSEGVAVGYGAQSTQGVSIGYDATCSGSNSVVIGHWQTGANFTQSHSVVLGSLPPTSQQTSEPYNTKGFYWAEGEWDSTASKYKIYKLFNQDGSLVTKRLADTTNAQQGDVLTLDSTGNAVWQAGGSAGGVPTLTWYTISTAGTTLTIADTSSAQLVKIYKNGLLLQPTEDYTISGTTLTTVSAMVVGDKITTEVF